MSEGERVEALQIEACTEKLAMIRQIIWKYQELFHEAPFGVAMACQQMLELRAGLAYSYQVPLNSMRDAFKIDGVDIYPKMSGPPEVIPRREDITALAYMTRKDDPRIQILLMGA